MDAYINMKTKIEKVDKGFCLSYFKLSYRRKLIRTLWFTPLCLFFLFADSTYMYFTVFSPGEMTLFLLFISVLQIIYNYYKWKKES